MLIAIVVVIQLYAYRRYLTLKMEEGRKRKEREKERLEGRRERGRKEGKKEERMAKIPLHTIFSTACLVDPLIL